MIDWNTLKAQTMGYRRAIAELLASEVDRAHVRPPTWNNNLHWHAGHLVVTPHILTHGLLGEPLPLPADYRRWFAKGSNPTTWGEEPVPAFEFLVNELVERVPAVFDAFEDRADARFPEPYMTSVGVVLRTPAEALSFSMAHDGLHMGMIQALKRGLNGMRG